MSIRFKLSDFDDYKHDKDVLKSTSCQALVSNAAFKSNEDTLAIIGCGGTMSSVYSPLHESIHATNHSPINDLINDLDKSFGIADTKISYLPLINKDSREIVKRDIVFLLDILNSIENCRIVLACGTYGLPLLTQILGKHLTAKNKTAVVTGSMLPSAFREQDSDTNGLSALSIANAIHKLRKEDDESPIILATFHGNTYFPEECESLNLHPASHSNVKFYRGVRFRTE